MTRCVVVDVTDMSVDVYRLRLQEEMSTFLELKLSPFSGGKGRETSSFGGPFRTNCSMPLDCYSKGPTTLCFALPSPLSTLKVRNIKRF
jgi:hypothetical protein